VDNDTAVRYTKCKGGEAMREKKDINIEIGGNIQVAREQAGYTQDTLSEMLGMTPNHLSAIERGASGISLEALQRLYRLLRVSADRISLGLTSQKRKPLRLPDVFRI
jgi:transcriptional regulator with XRE-family HTH domain